MSDGCDWIVYPRRLSERLHIYIFQTTSTSIITYLFSFQGDLEQHFEHMQFLENFDSSSLRYFKHTEVFFDALTSPWSILFSVHH